MKNFLFKFTALLCLLCMGVSNAWGEETTPEEKPSSFFCGFEDTNFPSNDANWVYSNLVAHNSSAKSGNYSASTGGKGTASLTYNRYLSKVKTVSFSASKTSNNTTSSSWKIQTSTDGKNWEDAKSFSATSMNKEQWADYSYTFPNAVDRYIRIFYNGSTAIRLIDDVLITLEDADTPVIETCETPTFSIKGDLYTSTQSVTLSCATEGASIYYTTNGSDPTASSTLYTSAISVSESTTIKAIATKDGCNNSAIASATYTIVNCEGDGSKENPYTLTDVANLNNPGTKAWVIGYIRGSYNNGSLPEFGTTEAETNIVLTSTIDGTDYRPVGLKSNSNARTDLNLKSHPENKGHQVKVYGTLTQYFGTQGIKDATEYGWVGDAPVATVATPVFSIPGRVYGEPVNVEISCTTEGASIYYTTDGNDPTASSTPFTSAITISESTTIKAIAIKEGMNNSEIASATYTFILPTSIEISGISNANAKLWKGDEFTHEGIVVTATYEGSEPVVVTEDATFSGYDMTKAGEQTVTVSYGGKEVQYGINVQTIANTPESAHTVAAARAMINAGKDLNTPVYVYGTISQIESAYANGTISFYISVFGTTDDTDPQFLFYKNQKDAENKYTEDPNIIVGAEVTGFGYLTKYEDTYEFKAGNYLVSYSTQGLPSYEVTFDLQGHGEAISKLTNVLKGSRITAPADPTAQGYAFGGWYKEAEFTNAWDFSSDVVNGDITLYAKWTATKQGINAYEATNGGYSVNGQYINSYTWIGNVASVGETVNLTASPATGHMANASCWYIQDEDGQISVTGSGNDYSFVMRTSTATISATFIKKPTYTAPVISVPAGIEGGQFSEAFDATITIDNGVAGILYTMNGSDPATAQDAELISAEEFSENTYTVHISESCALRVICIDEDQNTVSLESSMTFTYVVPKAHTIAFDAGTGSCEVESLTESAFGAGIILPSAHSEVAGWSFAGWAETSLISTTTMPTLYTEGLSFYPAGDCTLYAVYSISEAAGSGYRKISDISEIQDGEKYIFVISDGTASYAIQQNSTNSVAFTEGDGQSNDILWTAGTGEANGFSFQCNSKYIYNNGSNTTLSSVGMNPTYWVFTSLGNETFKMQNASTSGRYIAWTGSKFAAYAVSNFKNQFDNNSSLAQYDGALFIYKYGPKSIVRYDSNPRAPKTISKIEISGISDANTKFWKGDVFTHSGIVVDAIYDDDSTEDVTDRANFPMPALNSAGTMDIEVEFEGKTDTYQIIIQTIANTLETAYTVEEAKDFIDAGNDLSTKVYVKGIISSIVTEYDPNYGNISFNVSTDGETTGLQFEFFRTQKDAEAKYSEDPGIEVGATVVGYGELVLYNKSIYEFKAGNYIVSYRSPALSLTVSSAGWASYTPAKKIELPANEELKYYYVRGSLESNTVSYETIEAGTIIDAGTGILVNAPEGTYSFPVSTDDAETLEGNQLVGVLEATSVDGLQHVFIFTKKDGILGFYPWASGSLAAGKCYLQLTEIQAAAGLHFFGLPDEDGEMTTLSTIEEAKPQNAVFNLMGQKVDANRYRGITINRGGNKVIKH